MKIRVIHFDMKSMIPTAEYMMTLVEEIAELGYTHLLMEFEDKFPFDSFPAIVHKAAWSKEDFRKLNEKCRSLGLSIIPLLQCAGHLDYMLKHDEYKDLRDGDTTYQWCLADHRVFPYWKEMAQEILEIFPECEYFHIGADEVQMKYSCPRCSKMDKFALYLNQVEACTDFLREHGKKVVLWDDVFRNHELNPLKKLLSKVIPCVWQYLNIDESIVQKYADLGIEFWGASKIQHNWLYRGMGAQNPVRKNVDDWAEISRKYDITGHIGTIWGRNQCLSPICDTLPQSMYMVAYLGESLRHGRIVDIPAYDRHFGETFFDLPGIDMNIIEANFGYEPEIVKAELEKWIGKAPRHNDILEIFHAFNEIDVLYRYVDMCFSADNALYPAYCAGFVPEEQTSNWLDGVRITEERTNELKEKLYAILGKYFQSIQLDEFFGQRFDFMLLQNAQWKKIILQAVEKRLNGHK